MRDASPLRIAERGSVKGLYPKIMVLIGSVFAVIMIAIVVFVHMSSGQQLEREWLSRAETLNRMAFEALYASLSHGGGRQGNLEVIARLQEIGAFTNVRVLRADSVIREFGAALDEGPLDDLEQQALAGEEVGAIVRDAGYGVVRYVTPLRVEADCLRCHQTEIGTINGIISTEISLREYEDALRGRRNALSLGLAGGLLALGLLTFLGLRRLVIRPLRAIQQGTASLAQGDLDYRLQLRTGDELEALAGEFNRMARRLQVSYGRIAEEQGKVLAAIEASQDAIWVSDADRQVVLLNSAMVQLTGKRREELLGQTCRTMIAVHNDEGASICNVACPFLRSGDDGGKVEGYITDGSGTKLWVEISFGRVIDAHGRLAGAVHIVHDLTQRKEIEQLKDEFISMVSHELRTPLTHIKGFATTLLQTDVVWDAATQRDFLGSISREADRLTDLVGKILHLSRLEAGGLPKDREWYQVADLVDGALQRQRGSIDDRQVDLHLSPDLPAVFVDGREIEVVLMNLMENAAKYSAPGAPIALTVERRADRVIFCVADQGIGIAPKDLDRVIERFYRVNDERFRVPGSGLGLAICQRIVQAHGGHIWVESTPGVGSRFCFQLSVDRPGDSQSPSPAWRVERLT